MRGSGVHKYRFSLTPLRGGAGRGRETGREMRGMQDTDAWVYGIGWPMEMEMLRCAVLCGMQWP